MKSRSTRSRCSIEADLFAERLFDGEAWHEAARVDLDTGGRIVAVRPGRPEPGDRVESVVIPPFVNAHCHLEIGALAPGGDRDFVPWLGAVITSRASRGIEAASRTATANVAASLAAGVATFGDIDTLGAGREALLAASAFGCSYREVVGFDASEAEANDLVAGARLASTARLRAGLSPHAPYSVSESLFRAARGAARPLAIHCAETEDEHRFLRDGRGPFRGLLEQLGKLEPSFEPPGCSPLAWLASLGCTGPDVLLIHMHVLAPGDLELLARCGSPVVVCPGTIEWFGRRPPQVAAMLAAGVGVALGTDSLASNDHLDMFGEMAALRRLCPDLEPGRVLRMATSSGGRALGSDQGRIGAGRQFSAIALKNAPCRDETELTDWITSGAPGHEVVGLGRPWVEPAPPV